MNFQLSQKALSGTLGGASVTCWLFAQFPQVIENYRLSSCKGLALPFLVNWLLGDLTNLIGCIFTDQLPFQTYLATYFSLIDFVLICQYIYYTRRDRRLRQSTHHHHHHQSSLKHSRLSASQHSVLGNHGAHRSSMNRSRPSLPSRSNTMTASSRLGVTSPARLNGDLEDHHDEVWTDPSAHHRKPDQQMHKSRSRTHSTDDVHLKSGSTTPTMSESFHTQLSSASVSTLGALERGRRSARFAATTTANDPQAQQYDVAPDALARRHASGSRGRPLYASREPSLQSRSSSVVFLSVWTLAGLGSLYSTIALARRDVTITTTATESDAILAWKSSDHINTTVRQLATAAVGGFEQDPDVIDYSRLVGRVAAWMCVCFYLTSRMPQIWKNFQRRSVEGLSILLFAAAFAGNAFYVSSILSSPLVQEEEGYLFESVPFLLGSGGTLVFDVIIMGQAYLYGKSGSRIANVTDQAASLEEHAGLLGSSTLDHDSRPRVG